MSNLDENMLNTKILNRKTYIFNGITYYKMLGMQSQYFIMVMDFHKASICQSAMKLFEEKVSGLVPVKAYVKTVKYSDVLFIAAPCINSSFKMYDLEKIS